MKLIDTIKSKIKEWLEKLAKSNESQFGNKELDCCNMNKNDKLIK